VFRGFFAPLFRATCSPLVTLAMGLCLISTGSVSWGLCEAFLGVLLLLCLIFQLISPLGWVDVILILILYQGGVKKASPMFRDSDPNVSSYESHPGSGQLPTLGANPFY
jgi:hypothetical protein